MPYDEALAARVRALLKGEDAISEKRMFGGLAFLLEGNMAVSASGNGGLMVRVDPAEGERLVASTVAVPMVMRGREMAGWLRVAEGLDSDDELATWVRRGTDYARTLPPKE
jgi:TfoX/Sxy family transcriptional regulator of competence genes